MSYNDAIQDAKDQMQKVFEYLEKELKGIRTGRASSAWWNSSKSKRGQPPRHSISRCGQCS